MSMISVDYDVLNQRGSPAWFSDVYANIPTAGYKGRMFISTDTYAFYRDTGTGWDLIGGPGTGTITGSGASGQVSYFNGSSSLAGSNNLFWDITNSRLGIGTATPGASLDIHSTGTNAQFNGTGTNNAYLVFQNAGTSKWRIGNTYNTGANSFDIYNNSTSASAISISAANLITTSSIFCNTSLTSNGTFTANTNINITNGSSITVGAGYNVIASDSLGFFLVKSNSVNWAYLLLSNLTAPRNFTFPDTSGTLALTSQLTSGTVTSVAAITLGTTGTDLSSSVANSTTTPVITLNVPTASASNRGALSSADWTTFNNKFLLPSLTSGSVLFSNGTTISQSNANFYFDSTNFRLGVGTTFSSSNLPTAGVTSYSTTSSTQFKAAGTSAGITFSDTIAAPTYAAAIGIATAVNNFVTGTAIGDMGIVNQSTTPGAIVFGIGSLNEKARISSSGNLLVGSATDSGSGKLQVTGAASFTSNVGIGTSSPGSLLQLEKSSFPEQRITDGTINFQMYASTGNSEFVQGTYSNHALVFRTNSAERMRITSGGDVYINTDSSLTGRFGIKETALKFAQIIRHDYAGTQYFMDFKYNTTDIGNITGNNTNTTFSTSSDYRLKEDLKDFDGIDLVTKLNVYDFAWKSDNTRRMYGVVAHEMAEILPYAITGQKDDVYEDGHIKSQGVDYSLITPLLVKAIQELNEKLIRNNIN